MSSEEFVSAYLDGQISRRTLIRRLVATGVSIGAAISYAHLLRPTGADAKAPSEADFYANYYADVTIKSGSIRGVLRKGYIRVRLDVSRHEFVDLLATVRHNGHPVRIAKATVQAVPYPPRFVHMHLNKKGRKLLREHNQMRVVVTAHGDDGHYHTVTSHTARRLT